MIGHTLGKYRIVERIGRGGMGTVYRAVDETLDREVAIKVINPELVEDESARRFRAEAVMLARVNHPNIATVHDLIREGDQLLMVMELVRGQTFEHLLDMSAPIRVDRAAALMGQVLDALDHAHSAGIVHRDLKPANLMLTPTGTVKVMDFGIARASGSARLTGDGVMIGTPAYMPPEQVRGEEVDGRADIYAAAVVLYRMVTGQLPFKAPTAVAMIQSQLSDAPTPPREVRAELPEWLEAVLLRALAKRPGDRFQTAADFRAALEQRPFDSQGLTQGRPPIDHTGPTIPLTPKASPSPTPVRAEPSTVAAAPTPIAAPTGSSSTTTVVLNRSHLAMGGLLVVLLVAAVGVAVWLAMRQQTPLTPPTTTTTAPPAVQSAAEPVAPPKASSTVEQRAAVSPRSPATPAVGAAPPPPPPAPTAPKEPTAATDPAGGRTATPPEMRFPTVAAPPPFARGRAGRDAERARGADGSTPGPFEITNVRTYVNMPGRGGRFLPTTLQFGEKAFTMSDGRRGGAERSVSYDKIKRAAVSRSKTPRGPGGVEIPLRGGGVDLSNERVWLTVLTETGPLLFWVDPIAVRPIANQLRQRANIVVEMLNP